MTVPVWEAPFLKALERCGVASEAARLAGTGARNAFKRRKGNATFAAAWDAAVALHRSEAGRRALSAVHGEPAPPPSCGRSPSPSKLGEDLASRQVVGGAKLERAGQSRWSKRAEETFLAELTVSANVRIAAAAAGFSAAAAYKRRLKDRHLAAAWDAALEVGKARVQSYLVEAATRTFDPDELPIGDDRDIPKVSISEAINIAKLKAGPSASLPSASLPSASLPSASLGMGEGFVRGGKGFEDRIYDETGFDMTPISRDEWDEAKTNIVHRLTRLREQMEEEERETGRCKSCGQMLPAEAADWDD